MKLAVVCLLLFIVNIRTKVIKIKKCPSPESSKSLLNEEKIT